MPHSTHENPVLPDWEGLQLVERILARKRMNLIMGGSRAGKRTMQQEMARQHALRQKIALASPTPPPIASIRYACMSPTEHETLDNQVHHQLLKRIIGDVTPQEEAYYQLVGDAMSKGGVPRQS